MTGTRFRSFAQLLSIIRAVQAPSRIYLEDVTFLHRGFVRSASLAAARARLQQLSFRSTQIPFNVSIPPPIAEFIANHHVLQLADITADNTITIVDTFQDLLRLFEGSNFSEYASLELRFQKYHECKSLLRECPCLSLTSHYYVSESGLAVLHRLAATRRPGAALFLGTHLARRFRAHRLPNHTVGWLCSCFCSWIF